MLFTVLDYRTKKSVGSYESNYISNRYPFDDAINLLHYQVEEGKLSEGYYLTSDNSVAYDFSYTKPVSPDIILITEETIRRHEEGTALYQKVLADIQIRGNLSLIDQTIQIYPIYLLSMRCFLKDGMGETSLRYLMKHLAPLGLFSSEQVALYREWLLEYCRAWKPAIYSVEEYELRLTAVETQEVI